MKYLLCLSVILLTLAGCGDKQDDDHDGFDEATIDTSKTLMEARKGFKSNLKPKGGQGAPVATPPANLFQVVQYDSPVGKLPAYLSPDPKDGKKHPAIVWITGGDSSTIGSGCWEQGRPSNDQSASAYRKAGLVMMFPSLRGGNRNPGKQEAFLGEVEDVIAAADFLSKQPYVDPERIYLGGHSTGGTLALLTAESTDRFRAVFSFGPAHDVSGYGPDYLPFDTSNPKEIRLRSPGYWLHCIKSPTFVIEGEDGNAMSLEWMKQQSNVGKAQFFLIRGATHLSVLSPTNQLIAQRILRDTGAKCNLDLKDKLGQPN